MVELTIPSVCYILGMILFVAVAFLLESRLTPYMLAILSTIILFLVAKENYRQFYDSEYTWTSGILENFYQNIGFYFYGAILVTAIVVYSLMSKSPVNIPVPEVGPGFSEMGANVAKRLQSFL
jgi:hypothetical protein